MEGETQTFCLSLVQEERLVGPGHQRFCSSARGRDHSETYRHTETHIIDHYHNVHKPTDSGTRERNGGWKATQPVELTSKLLSKSRKSTMKNRKYQEGRNDRLKRRRHLSKGRWFWGNATGHKFSILATPLVWNYNLSSANIHSPFERYNVQGLVRLSTL